MPNFGNGLTAAYDGDNMLHGKRIGVDVHRTQAVFAKMISTAFDFPTQTFCDILRQQVEPSSLAASSEQEG